MELIDPLNGAGRPQPRIAQAGLLNPLASTVKPVTAGYELGNMDLCPDCGQPMEKMLANDVMSNVCIPHRVCLPVKDPT